jgi:hypothetical protein
MVRRGPRVLFAQPRFAPRRGLTPTLTRGLAVFDVTDGMGLYGANGVYEALVGVDASRLLAKGILQPESEEEARQPLTRAEEQTLREWHEFYTFKYGRVGKLVERGGVGASSADDVRASGNSDQAAGGTHADDALVDDGWRVVDSGATGT